MKKFGIVYIITNLVTGKRYIGQTTQKLRRRWRQHCYDKRSGRHLHLSISKYGEANFRIEEFMVCFDQYALDYFETLLIEQLGTFTPKGYNLCKGALKKGEITEETRRKMREAKLGKKATNSGWSEESKLQHSKSRGGRPIVAVNLTTGEIRRYDYITQASRDGFKNSEIYRVLKKQRKHHLNYKFYYENEYVNQSGSADSKESEHAQRLGFEPTSPKRDRTK